MHAQLVYFDGPRPRELVDASDRASWERIAPALAAHPDLDGQLVANYQLRRPDGSEVIVTVARSGEALRTASSVIAELPLLPGEDPALLPGPDRVEVYEVVAVTGDDGRLNRLAPEGSR
ncbi:MAG: hypothetical protein ACRDO7_17760 [Nocardioidaceae bacterium]